MSQPLVGFPDRDYHYKTVMNRKLKEMRIKDGPNTKWCYYPSLINDNSNQNNNPKSSGVATGGLDGALHRGPQVQGTLGT